MNTHEYDSLQTLSAEIKDTLHVLEWFKYLLNIFCNITYFVIDFPVKSIDVAPLSKGLSNANLVDGTDYGDCIDLEVQVLFGDLRKVSQNKSVTKWVLLSLFTLYSQYTKRQSKTIGVYCFSYSSCNKSTFTVLF